MELTAAASSVARFLMATYCLVTAGAEPGRTDLDAGIAVSAPATTAHPAGDTVAGTLAARYPHLSPGQCGLLETAIVRGLTVAAGGGCALAGIWPQPAAPCTSAPSLSRPGRDRPRRDCSGGFPPP